MTMTNEEMLAECQQYIIDTLGTCPRLCKVFLDGRCPGGKALIEEEYKKDIHDFGPSECCPERGRMRYYGGSRYYCNWCGREKIRRMGRLEPA